MGCAFCQIVAGEKPGDVLFQDDSITAFRDFRPQAPTHILIIPNQHFSRIEELLSTDEMLFVAMFRKARDLAKSEGIAERGYRLVINNGPGAGQGIDHLHLHLLGGRPMSEEDMALRWKGPVS
jgi:histidine triad (HIT) family protein